MQQTPSAHDAILDVAKLRDYCLNPLHPRGRHKARVFEEALGLRQRDAASLQRILLTGIRESAPNFAGSDGFGVRWRYDVSVARLGKQAVVRTIWIVRPTEQQLRFVTCWVT